MNSVAPQAPAPAAPEPPRGPGRFADDPRRLAALGVCIGLGLAALGFVAAVMAWVDPPSPVSAENPVSQLARALRAGWLILAFACAAGVSFCLLRFWANILEQQIKRDSKRSVALQDSLDRAIGLLQRIVQNLESREAGRASEPSELPGTAHAMAEIETAIRDGQWALARSLLDEFATVFPGNEKASTLDESLRSARRRAVDEQIAQLTAAREVNDPARVLDLYHRIAPELDPEAHAALRSEIASWFLSLFYRRLRTGKIQAEIVQLAADFANSFAATTEGASVAAALPTLRRSAGLCPRCGQPYTGIEQACPECLRPARKAVSVPETSPGDNKTDS